MFHVKHHREIEQLNTINVSRETFKPGSPAFLFYLWQEWFGCQYCPTEIRVEIKINYFPGNISTAKAVQFSAFFPIEPIDCLNRKIPDVTRT